jgi:hypothetical protein
MANRYFNGNRATDVLGQINRIALPAITPVFATA